MKVRNKKTGEVVILIDHIFDNYKSLAELNKEWEDAPEEPKGYWWICSGCADVVHCVEAEGDKMDKYNKEIGNYFETREEAELAVRKLKAWKRLKDFGCRLVLDDHFAVKFVGPDATKITSAEEQKSLSDAYNLLFGGE